MMTDNEIIKALECCKDTEYGRCKGCPLNTGRDFCSEKLHGESFEIINRQKTEIEALIDVVRGLTSDIEWLRKANGSCSCMGMLYSEIKADAYKEFADALKNCFCISKEYLDVMTLIDGTLRELTEKGR